jgi:hypothetical protein
MREIYRLVHMTRAEHRELQEHERRRRLRRPSNDEVICAMGDPKSPRSREILSWGRPSLRVLLWERVIAELEKLDF